MVFLFNRKRLMVRVGRHLPCNPPEVVKTLGETVFKMLDNIIANPEEPKFRDLRATNKTLQSKVLNAHGGKELLHLLGFEKIFKFGENYYFMSEVSLDYLQQAKGWLQQVSCCCCYSVVPA
jgi:PUB domain